MSQIERFGKHTLICGDAMDWLGGLSIDMVITDPPYSSGARRDADRQVRGSMLRSMEDEDWFSHDAMTSWGFSWFVRGAFAAIRKNLTAGGHVYAFTDWRQTPNIYGMLEACGYRVNQCLVWKKAHFGMGAYWRNQHENIVFASHGTPTAMLDRGMGSVLERAAVSPSARVHPTEKPVDLILDVIEAAPGQIILDPFMGSGTTGVACVKAGREFVGIEIEQHYFDIACKRLEEAYRQGNLFPPAANTLRPEALPLPGLEVDSGKPK